MRIAQRLQSVKPSATLAVSSKAAALKAAGKSIINLSVGEPDFDTPNHIKEAAIDAIRQGKTKYTPVAGTPSLKRAIVEKFSRENGLCYAPEQILVSAGCKHGLYNLMQALIDAGDEVLIPAPYWTSYPDIVALAGGSPKILKTDMAQGFKLSAEILEQRINRKTRALILNSPSNPSGICYSAAELRSLAEVLLAHPEVWIISDDIYEHIQWREAQFCNLVMVCPELYARTIVCNGVSKSYAMTGWRIGYAAGAREVIAAMEIIQSQSTSNPSSIAQAAAEEAIQGDQSYITMAKGNFMERHAFVHHALSQISGVRCYPAEGTFYVFPDMQEVIARLPSVHDDIDLANYLLEKAEIAVVPGSAFGAPGFVRFSFAVSMETLQDAMRRLQEVLA